MSPIDKGCCLQDGSDQMQYLHYDQGLASIQSSDEKLHPAYNVGPGV